VPIATIVGEATDDGDGTISLAHHEFAPAARSFVPRRPLPSRAGRTRRGPSARDSRRVEASPRGRCHVDHALRPEGRPNRVQIITAISAPVRLSAAARMRAADPSGRAARRQTSLLGDIPRFHPRRSAQIPAVARLVADDDTSLQPYDPCAHSVARQSTCARPCRTGSAIRTASARLDRARSTSCPSDLATIIVV